MKLNRISAPFLWPGVRAHSTHQNCVSNAQSGSANFEKEFKTTHLETSAFQKVLLSVGSAVLSIADPRRGDMIAVLGETTGSYSVNHIKEKMLCSTEGRRILDEKPRINSSTVDLEKLNAMPEGTLGKAYSNFLNKFSYTPDARLAVRFVDDLETAYIIQRYREVHDLVHTLLDMPTNMLGEVAVKWVEAIQTKLPMCVGGALFGPMRLAPKFSRSYSTASRPQLTFDTGTLEAIEQEKATPKTHPGIMRLPCVVLRPDVAATVGKILAEHNLAQMLPEAQTMWRHLQGRKPPIEMGHLKSLRSQIWQEVSEMMDTAEELTQDQEEAIHQMKTNAARRLLRGRVYNWQPMNYTTAQGLQYLLVRGPADYAVLTKIFNEITKRDAEFKPKTLFDFGSGVGTVSWAAHSFWGESLKEYFTVDTSREMNDLALRILQRNDVKKEPFTKTLFQRQFLPATRTKFDLVVSAYSLMELDSLRSRTETILNLWNRTRKYLVVIENGTNAGFQLIGEVRDLIRHVSEKAGVKFHVAAPCPHDLDCPRLNEVASKQTPCGFVVKFQELETKKRANPGSHVEVFSYVVIKRGERQDDPQWSRVVRPVLKRHKHTVCRLCTSAGKLDEVVITPKKHGKIVYKCSRYTEWGDLIPGAIEPTETDDNHEATEPPPVA